MAYCYGKTQAEMEPGIEFKGGRFDIGGSSAISLIFYFNNLFNFTKKI